MTQLACERWPMVDKLPVVHDRVWELLRQMRYSVEYVGRFYGGGQLQRAELERPLVDRHRSRGVYTSVRPVIYGVDDHRDFKDWIAPNWAQRRGQRRRGPDAVDKERYDNFAFRRGLLVSSLEAVSGNADGRYGGMERAINLAWIASHFDRVVDDLCYHDHLTSDALELRFEWRHADADQKQQLLADLHPNAPAAYAFAEAVGEQTKRTMSAEETLECLNNPAEETADVAAGLLMDGSDPMWHFGHQGTVKYAELKAEVSELIRTEWDNATPSGDIVQLASDLIGRHEQALDQPQARTAEITDPRKGMSDPTGAVKLTKAPDTASTTAAAPGKQGLSKGIGH